MMKGSDHFLMSENLSRDAYLEKTLFLASERPIRENWPLALLWLHWTEAEASFVHADTPQTPFPKEAAHETEA